MSSQFHISVSPTGNPNRFDTEIRDEVCAMQYHTDVESNPEFASFVGVKAGAVDILRYTGCGVQRGVRTQTNIRLDRADYYLVCVPESAGLGIRHNGNAVELSPGSLTFISTSLPLQALIRSTQENSSFSTIYARVPGPMLRRQIPNIDQLCGRALNITQGPSQVMLSLFTIALDDGPYLSDMGRRNFGDFLFEVASGVAHDALGDVLTSPGQKLAHRRVFDRAIAFINLRLADSALNPTKVAVHCGVSLRYLHAAFASLSPFSVSGFIRERRLQGCQSVLKNPIMKDWTITHIAGEWGFDNPSQFCHLYKNRFKKTPREDRATATVSQVSD